MSFHIRFATEQDLIHIQHIYNEEILTGFATWNALDQDLVYYQQWFHHHAFSDFPIFVIVEDDSKEIAGYAEYSSFRNFNGYKSTVEHSVYIDPKFKRLGLGKRLLEHLIHYARKQQLHVMIAAIDHENFASIHLHEKFGFKQTGYLPEVGQKFGAWRDLVLLQLNLNG